MAKKHRSKYQQFKTTQIHIRSCLQKTTYSSRFVAEQEGSKYGLTAYKCPDCSAFHLTSKPKLIHPEPYCMLKRLTQLTIIGFLLCSLPMPVEARSSSSSSSSSSRSSSSSSFKSSPSTSSSSTSYSRSSSSTAQTKPTTSSSSSNSSSTFGSSYNSSYSSRPVEIKPSQAVTKTKPSVTTTYLPEYRLPNTTGRTETRYVTIFSDSGTRTVPVVVPFGHTQPIVLPQSYYPNTSVVVGEWSIWRTIGQIITFLAVGIIILVLLAGLR